MSEIDFLAKPKGVEGFKAFLTARGCEVLAPTNPWEVIRFRAAHRVNVVYKNKSGVLSPSGDDIPAAAEAFRTQGQWRPLGRAKRSTGARKRARIVRTLLERDGTDCFFCAQPLGEDITVEELLSIASGGQRIAVNCALAHKDCNNEAGHLSIVEKVKLRDRKRAARN